MTSRLLKTSPLLILVISGCSMPAGSPVNSYATENKIVKSGKESRPYRIIKKQSPRLPTFKELEKIARDPTYKNPSLNKLWHTPIIDNTVYYQHGMPSFQKSPKIGERLRIATWNIEKSLSIKDIAKALHSERSFKKNLLKNKKLKKASIAEILRQRNLLAESDIILLQEMDIGHNRSGYINAASHLARALEMNYTYGLQHLEVDPVHLGLNDLKFPNRDIDYKAKALPLQSHKYHGMFGVAILSRYPIKRVILSPLKNQSYDWYSQEAARTDLLEQSRRLGTQLLFKHRVTREIKVGGRNFMRVDLHIPELPLETLSVINVHLEIKTTPKQREAEIKEILTHIKDIPNPVVLAGDFNSSPIDLSPTSVARTTKRMLTTPSDLLNIGLVFADLSRLTRFKNIVNFYKNYRDPLAADTPLILPNKQQSMFRTIRDFRFSDGGAFDFRGDSENSQGRYHGVLSNSNQRYGKGFEFTFSVPRPIGPFGYEKLDWIFIKSFLQHPNDSSGTRRLSPHFGETLTEFNKSRKPHFSDHRPMIVDLPIHQPREKQ